MMLIMLVAGFAAGFVKRGWLIVLAAPLLACALVLAGAFDDGEGAAAVAAMAALLAISTGVGWMASVAVQRLATKPRPV